MSATPTHTHRAGRGLILPDDDRFDEARRAWNLAIDQRPSAVMFPESAEDVAAAVVLAREHRLRIAAQGTGHNAGPLGSLENTILLKTERLRGVRIDPQQRIARVEAGALWLEVVEAAARHGLAALAGSSPDVGVVGYTLGGGLSFLGRKHGLCANAVRAIEIVTADGRLRRCDEAEEPDLFWALRGGGGSFGVVTAIELELFPIEQAYAGVLFYPIERGREVLHAWRELTRDDAMPDELTTVGRFLRLPAMPEIPEPVRGRSFVMVEAYHLGARAEADALLAPLRSLGPVSDTIGTVPMPALSHLHMDPPGPTPAAGDGMLLAELPPRAVDALVDVAGAQAAFPLVTVEVRQLGGALARPRAAHGAISSLDADYSMFAAGVVPVPELAAPVRAQVNAVKAALAPWAAPQRYLNLADTQGDPATFWGEPTLRRLRRIKAEVDPSDRIQANHPVLAANATTGTSR
jgi:UDP-N-acetylenolpyruvoylglucosamine reductase